MMEDVILNCHSLCSLNHYKIAVMYFFPVFQQNAAKFPSFNGNGPCSQNTEKNPREKQILLAFRRKSSVTIDLRHLSITIDIEIMNFDTNSWSLAKITVIYWLDGKVDRLPRELSRTYKKKQASKFTFYEVVKP